MDLILWRHAEAEEGGPDLERRLTPKGRKQAKRVAAWLLQRLPSKFALLSSPALRARQTAEALELRTKLVEQLAPGAGVSDVLEAVDWVNVVPLTSDDEVVFIELHRHGTDRPSLEIPGGMIDPEDPSPIFAAAREMQEETGYASDALEPLGVVHPNPAIQANRCFSFLAKDARLVGPPSPDEGEDIRVVRYPLQDVPALIAEGKITHALVVTCFYWLYQREGRFIP